MKLDLDALAKTNRTQKWWVHMADIWESVEGGNEPVATPLQTLFHMP